jgi:hypothetical protein
MGEVSGLVCGLQGHKAVVIDETVIIQSLQLFRRGWRLVFAAEEMEGSRGVQGPIGNRTAEYF